ncbi:MAG: SpoIIE family protein phosphatase, partial [Acidobacteriota bacterium]|nr:SpoIIE family protein phosphatase [Acidobacteriota bacterium]
MPNRRPFPGIRFLVLVFAACVLSPPVHASDPRNVDASSFGERITLGPDWLFSPGDNPVWASPAFDDSGWRVVSSNKQLLDYGIHDIKYGWYRVHIRLRPGVSGLMVGTQHVFGSYEIYANGVRIGSAGRIAGIPVYAQRNLVVIPVPAHLVTPQGELVLALRFALEATGANGSGTDTPIGPGGGGSGIYLLSVESAAREMSYVDAHNTADLWALACLSLLIGFVAIALFSTMRSQREYLACAVFLFAESGYLCTGIWQLLLAHAQTSTVVLFSFLGIVNVAVIEFVRLVLGIPRSRWLLGLEIASFIAAFAGVNIDLGLIPESYSVIVLYLPDLIVLILLPVLLVRACLRGNREAWVLLPAVLLRGLDRYWSFSRIMARLSGLAGTWEHPTVLHIGSYTTTLRSFGGFVFFITILLFLVVRTVGIARERAHAADELEAARVVQQVLIPEEIPDIPGFTIQSVYKPAGQVGGDFFQILPLDQGGVLVVIGDVSGKGMPAAMMVSLLVGKLQTLAEFTSSPAEILKGLNRHLQ